MENIKIKKEKLKLQDKINNMQNYTHQYQLAKKNTLISQLRCKLKCVNKDNKKLKNDLEKSLTSNINYTNDVEKSLNYVKNKLRDLESKNKSNRRRNELNFLPVNVPVHLSYTLLSTSIRQFGSSTTGRTGSFLS